MLSVELLHPSTAPLIPTPTRSVGLSLSLPNDDMTSTLGGGLRASGELNSSYGPFTGVRYKHVGPNDSTLKHVVQHVGHNENSRKHVGHNDATPRNVTQRVGHNDVTPRNVTQHVGQNDVTLNDVVLPEKQLFLRYRHVYAGKGGWYGCYHHAPSVTASSEDSNPTLTLHDVAYESKRRPLTSRNDVIASGLFRSRTSLTARPLTSPAYNKPMISRSMTSCNGLTQRGLLTSRNGFAGLDYPMPGISLRSNNDTCTSRPATSHHVNRMRPRQSRVHPDVVSNVIGGDHPVIITSHLLVSGHSKEIGDQSQRDRFLATSLIPERPCLKDTGNDVLMTAEKINISMNRRESAMTNMSITRTDPKHKTSIEIPDPSNDLCSVVSKTHPTTNIRRDQVKSEEVKLGCSASERLIQDRSVLESDTFHSVTVMQPIRDVKQNEKCESTNAVKMSTRTESNTKKSVNAGQRLRDVDSNKEFDELCERIRQTGEVQGTLPFINNNLHLSKNIRSTVIVVTEGDNNTATIAGSADVSTNCGDYEHTSVNIDQEHNVGKDDLDHTRNDMRIEQFQIIDVDKELNVGNDPPHSNSGEVRIKECRNIFKDVDEDPGQSGSERKHVEPNKYGDITDVIKVRGNSGTRNNFRRKSKRGHRHQRSHRSRTAATRSKRYDDNHHADGADKKLISVDHDTELSQHHRVICKRCRRYVTATDETEGVETSRPFYASLSLEAQTAMNEVVRGDGDRVREAVVDSEGELGELKVDNTVEVGDINGNNCNRVNEQNINGTTRVGELNIDDNNNNCEMDEVNTKTKSDKITMNFNGDDHKYDVRLGLQPDTFRHAEPEGSRGRNTNSYQLQSADIAKRESMNRRASPFHRREEGLCHCSEFESVAVDILGDFMSPTTKVFRSHNPAELPRIAEEDHLRNFPAGKVSNGNVVGRKKKISDKNCNVYDIDEDLDVNSTLSDDKENRVTLKKLTSRAFVKCSNWLKKYTH